MPYCNECGKNNDDVAQYCTKCGNYIAEGSTFEKDIEKAAEEFGRKAEQFGKRMEKRFGKSAAEEGSDSKAKHCPACGAELDSGAKFCRKCGKKIE